VLSRLYAVEGTGLHGCAGCRTADAGRTAPLPRGGIRELDHRQMLSQLLRNAELSISRTSSRRRTRGC